MTEVLTRARMWERHAEIGKIEQGEAQNAAYSALHHEYYAQFITPACRHAVIHRIGRDRILASRDPHFNDIPLRHWDALAPLVRATCDVRRLKIAEPSGDGGFMWSLSTAVCIAKAVALDLREGRAG